MWNHVSDKSKCYPIFDCNEYLNKDTVKSLSINFVMIDCNWDENLNSVLSSFLDAIKDHTAVICLSSKNKNAVQSIRRMFIELSLHQVMNPVVIICDSSHDTTDESLIHYAVETGSLLIDGMGDGVCFWISLW